MHVDKPTTVFYAQILIYRIYKFEMNIHIIPIDMKKVDRQLTHAIHVKDRYANGTFIDKLTKWHQ